MTTRSKVLKVLFIGGPATLRAVAAFLPTLLAEDRTRRGWTVEQAALYDCILVDQRVGSVS
jgi:hypothetical protein